MKLFFSVLLIIGPMLLFAQRSGNPQKTYLSGKDFYQSGQYRMAMESFKSLTTYHNSFAEYATFYYGLSAYHDGQTEIAKNILLQLSRKYPNWNQRKEVYYWLGKLYFEKEDYGLALNQLNLIDDKSMSSQVVSLKLYYLADVTMEDLQKLHLKYPNDAEVAESLALTMGQQPLSKEDMVQLQIIIDQFNLSEEEITNQYVGPTVKKDRYKVAVCFPFLIQNVKEDRRLNSNQWVLDLYQGIQLAHKQLLSQNISIELYAYDTERDSIRTAEILSLDEMKSMDLIIGPLYPAPSELASSFAFNQKVNILNPLSSNTEIISHNPYSFLFHPADDTQAKVAAQYMLDQLDKDKKTLIIYGSRSADSIAAYQYRSVLMENEIEVIMMDQVPTIDPEEVARFVSENLYTIFTPDPDDPILLVEKKRDEDDEEDEDDEDEFIPRSDIDHIFVASSHELIVANIIGTVDNMGPELTIMGNDKWLQSRYMDFKQLERLQVYLAAPSFLNYSSNNFERFQRNYVRRYKSIPNNYSFIGYDLMMFFGEQLNNGGTYFQHDLRNKDFYAGTLFKGYSYVENNDNSYIPIVRFENGVLTQVNE
jgi:ABC-type branched-subunit amino acid transport system substrate-binding protein